MAKELPYFKFEPSEWENGLIQMCSRESKGLFIDIISIYWQRLGDLPYRFVLQKLCAGNANALQELIKEEIIKVEDDKIVINFLDLQLKEFNYKSNKASESAKVRWKKDAENQQFNANALQTESECNAIREEKIKEDKIIENNIVAKATPQAVKFNFRNELVKNGVREELSLEFMQVRKLKKLASTETAFLALKNEIEKSKKEFSHIIKICVENSWGGFKASWLETKTNETFKISNIQI